jgi:hypothetical protein
MEDVPAGEGRVIDADKGGRVKGRASISVQLTKLHVGGKAVQIATNTIEREARATKGKDAAKIGIGSGIGAAIGAIAGGGKGAAIGAGAGAAAGTGVVLGTRGAAAVIPSESVLIFELRAPFLDHEVIELGLALPDSLKARGTRGKVALRRAFASDLPQEILGAGKRGFGVPVAHWFRTDLRELAGDVLLGERASARGLFRRDAVERRLGARAAGGADHGARLSSLVMLELWQREYADQAAVAPSLAAAR